MKRRELLWAMLSVAAFLALVTQRIAYDAKVEWYKATRRSEPTWELNPVRLDCVPDKTVQLVSVSSEGKMRLVLIRCPRHIEWRKP